MLLLCVKNLKLLDRMGEVTLRLVNVLPLYVLWIKQVRYLVKKLMLEDRRISYLSCVVDYRKILLTNK